MKFRVAITLLGIVLLSLIWTAKVCSQAVGTGTLQGRVLAAGTIQPLPHANIVVVGTNNGTVTDLGGQYIIRGIEPGKRKIKASYVGYTTEEIEVTIKADESNELKITLQETTVEGEEVVVTAQRQGQQGAINAQISSNKIANVVAADRLQENPDANVAEAIARLPGVSLIRDGGEGVALVIRGMNPSYTKIYMDNVLIPTSNLSGLSQYNLQSVEVFKSITADMRGDAVAGSVNMHLSEAPVGFRSSVNVMGGYNKLNEYWTNYKFIANVSDRVFNDQLGVVFSVDAENTNRSNQTISAGYETKSVAPPRQLAPMYATTINLNDIKRLNRKSSVSLNFDYNLSPSTKLLFSNLYSHTDQENMSVYKSYTVTTGGASLGISRTPHSNSELYVGNLKAQHEFDLFELEEGISFSQSHAYLPETRSYSFSFDGTALSQFGTQAVQSMPLDQILAGATDTMSDQTLDSYYISTFSHNSSSTLEGNVDVYLNLKIPFQLEESISGFFKLGGEYQTMKHDQDVFYAYMPVGAVMGDYAMQAFPWAHEYRRQSLTMYGFTNGTVENFLKSQYNFGWYPDIDKVNDVFNWWTDFSNYYMVTDPANTPAPFRGVYLGYIPEWTGNTQNMQRVKQQYYAGYALGELKIGDLLSIDPGVRYEKVHYELGGWFYLPTTSSTAERQLSAPGYATSATQDNEFWLPMIHLKINPTQWLQAMLSFTQTLHRPDAGLLVPRTFVNTSSAALPFNYSAGNPWLRPEFWTGYDAQLAIFGNEVGLITVTGFYKKVKDVIWTPEYWRTAGTPWPYPEFNISQYFTDNSTVLITIPQNHSYPVYLKGLEFEVQTSFWYLPSPFNNITLDANFTLVNSETKYRYSKTSTIVTGYDNRGRPVTKLVSVDSIYPGPMLNQPKDIANFSLGYNYRGFNLWLSFQYTGAMSTSFPNLTEYQNKTSPFRKWDVQLTQKLPVEGLQLLLNLANFNDPVGFQNYLGDPRATYAENYGWTVDFGVRYSF